MEQLLLKLANTICGLAFRRVLAKRERDRQGRSSLTELIETQTSDVFVHRRFSRHIDTITDTVAQRLQRLSRHELDSIDVAEQQAAAHHAIGAFEGADLSDAVLFATDMKAERLAERILAAGSDGLAGAGLGEPGQRFYELLVRHTCECLVELATNLAVYQPRALTELLDRSSVLEEKLDAALRRLPLPSLLAPQGSVLDDEFRSRYLRTVSDRLDEVELFGVDVRQFQARTTLSVAYIGLSVRTRREQSARRPDPRGLRRWQEDREPSATERVLDVEDLLLDADRILIRGEAGSGKSTLLRWLAVNAARSAFEGGLTELNGMVPM
ncbi:MAG: NACHT domain-containing protein, partial [Stackebrandtia sp.]